jgi:hypothetical protein
LALKDNLAAPASGSAKVRFLNFSSHPSSLNAWLINTDATMKDSVLFTGISYIGSSIENTDSLSSFKTKSAGTYNVLLNSNTELNLFQDSSVTLTLTSGKIYTLYARGYGNGTSATDNLGLGIIQNH